MARVARIVVPGYPHHITQRGNRKANIFRTTVDRKKYLTLLLKFSIRHEIEIYAYCLMPNHVHIIAVPGSAESLSKCMQELQTAYALNFNKLNDESGHLYQGRFFSCALDEPHLWAAVRYVENNPVRAALVKRAESYPWSSAKGHCGIQIDPLLSRSFPPEGAVSDWSSWLRCKSDPAMHLGLKKCTKIGRPFGSLTFIKRLEVLMGRRLRKRKPGPKPDTKTEK